MANFGAVGMDWQQRINWDRLRTYRLERARERMKAHGLSALVLMYDENVRYVTSTLTPGWNRLKPGLRYAMLCGDDPPVIFEQGDIGMQLERHSPWIPKENIRYSYAWIKGAAGAASHQQVTKFTKAVLQEMKKSNVAGEKLGIDFVDINIIEAFKEAGIEWTDGMTPMMEARAIKNLDEQECMRIVGAIGDGAHWETMKFLKPGITENQVTAHIMQYLYNIPGMEDVEDVIVSSGPNTWPNWRNFSDRIIKLGDIVFMDLAALTWNGYKSCYYRTYCVGKEPSQDQKDVYATALKWLYDSIKEVKPGATTKDIASKWPSAKEAWGYEGEDQAAANLWGHGLGLAQYDQPVISRIWSLEHPIEIKPEAADSERFGPKAANLAALGRAGLPVPGGYCLDSEAYRLQLRALGLEETARRVFAAEGMEARRSALEMKLRLLDQPIAQELIEPLLGAWRSTTATEGSLGVVRSSALVEDRFGSSFAGQCESFLGLENEGEYLTAIRSCWCALWATRALRYMATHGLDPADTAMALIIQPLVHARSSGGGLSRTAEGEMLISATWGLGSAIAQGEVVPDRYVLTRDGDVLEMTAGRKHHAVGCEHGTRTVSRSEAEEPCLSAEQARELGAYLRGAEAVVDGPVEIEWTLDDAGFKLLQARPLHLGAPHAPDQIWDQHPRLRGHPAGVGWGGERDAPAS